MTLTSLTYYTAQNVRSHYVKQGKEPRIRYNDTYSRLADGTWVIQTRSSHFLISETRELA